MYKKLGLRQQHLTGELRRTHSVAPAEKKRGKYKVITDALRAEHLPFSVETTGALGETAQEVIMLIAWTAREYGSPWSPEEIKVHLMSSVAVATQRGNGLALAAAWNKEVEAVLGVVG